MIFRRDNGPVSSHKAVRLFLYFLPILAAALFVLCCTAFIINVWTPLSGNRSAPTVLIAIPRGVTVTEIGALLKEKKIIRSQRGFIFWCRLQHLDGRMMPGQYELSPAMPPRQIAELIAMGDQATDLVTIPEGYTIRQIAAKLAARGIVTEADFEQVASTQGKQFTTPSFQPPGPNLEGYLFPDTYWLPPGTPSRVIIAEMVDNFNRHIEAQSPGILRRRQYLSQIVNLASLIEREAQVDADRPLIAGVLTNRLRLKMPLDCDATIEYALPQHKSRLLFADLRVKSAYNTYTHLGLPPTPIANPGLACLSAALHPAVTKALYYVAGPTGRHIFTDTLAEHDRVITALRSGKFSLAESVAPKDSVTSASRQGRPGRVN